MYYCASLIFFVSLMESVMEQTGNDTAGQVKSAAKKAKPKRERNLKYSRAQFPVPVQIANTHAQQIFQSDFEITSKAMYFISVMMHIIDSESNAAAAEEQVNKILSGCIEKLRDKKAVTSKLLEAQGCSEPEGFTYTNILNTVVTVDSPRLITYLNILRELDSYIRMLDVAWFFSLIDDKTRMSEIFKAKRLVTDESYRIRNLWLRVVRAAAAKNIQVTEESDHSLTVIEIETGNGAVSGSADDENGEAKDRSEATDVNSGAPDEKPKAAKGKAKE